jgi:predicted RecA/RadA family phage recombinase
MSQNFMQDGVTLTIPVSSGVTKIYSGCPVYISGGGVMAPATTTSGIDGVATATCAGTADPGNYIPADCTFRTDGVFAFAPAQGTTLAIGNVAYVAVLDNSTASPVAYEQVGARFTIKNAATATGGDVAIGKVVGLGGGWGFKNLPATYGLVLIATRSNSNLANA